MSIEVPCICVFICMGPQGDKKTIVYFSQRQMGIPD